MKNDNRKINTRSLLMVAGSLLPLISFSQEQEVQTTATYFSNSLFNTLLVVIIILLIMIAALGSALKNVIGSDLYIEKLKKGKEENSPLPSKTTGLVIFFMLTSLAASSQDKIMQLAKDDRIGGLDQFTFYCMIVIIGIELLVLGILFNTFKNILGADKSPKKVAGIKPKTITILDKLNDTVEIEKEESILLDHDYDGIRELDNNLPPWWKYGFYLTIVVALIYLINYHITKTAPLQREEYSNSLKKAEAEIAEYMKSSANNVDENTVKTLTDASDLTTGKDLFAGTCAACHGKLGEGGVGPNLTDQYWLHGGSIKDIFKTIKYGWSDKGMKSWKEDFSPMQIAQLASFIRSIKGTNPPKAKDRQGELYIEQNTPADSAATKPDSTKALNAELPK